jgi:5-methylcytosine-specific restriction protein A
VNYGRRWKRERARYLADHPYCSTCGRLAEELDHVQPHRGDAVLFWSEANWSPLCKSCHSTKTAAEVGFGGRQ